VRSRRRRASQSSRCFGKIGKSKDSRPADPKLLSNEGGELVLAAESLMSSPISLRDTQMLMAPLLAVLRELPLDIAGRAAAYMAQIPQTRDTVESELLQQINKSPDRAATLATYILVTDVKSAKAYAAFGLTSTASSSEVRIECLREAVRLEPSMFLAQVCAGENARPAALPRGLGGAAQW
jgi:hypothetical protein